MDTNNNFELEQMRAQLGILKQKLEKQDIVNERLLRRSMKNKMSWINKYLVIIIFAIPFVAFAMLPMVMQMGISWWWYGFTLLMMTCSVVADWYVNYLRDDVFMQGNLLETAERLTRMKRLRLRQTIIGMIVVVGWLAWLFVELYLKMQAAAPGSVEHGMGLGYMWGVAFGAVIGTIVGLKLFFKMQRTNDEIINDIEELTNKE